MRSESIKGLIKVVMISGIVITLNMFNIMPSWASTLEIVSMPETSNKEVKTYNVDISVINHSNGLNIIYVKIGEKYLSLITDDNWKVGDKLTIRVNSNNQIIQAEPYVDPKIKYNLGENGTTYVNKLTTDKELQEYATKWLKDNYNMNLDIPVEFNTIKQDNKENYIVFGRTFYEDSKPIKIVINSDLNTSTNEKSIIAERMLIHELTHVVMCKKGLDYRDESKEFIAEALKNGASIDDKDNTNGVLHSHVLINQNIINN
jgi:hypothetical protein